MTTEPKYIPVEGRTPSIIKHCDDRTCDKYHTWIELDSSTSFCVVGVASEHGNRPLHDAAQIAKAMNLMHAPRPPLTVRDNPPMPSDHELNEIMVQNGGLDSRTTGLRAIWRHGCDAGMVAPESQGSST